MDAENRTTVTAVAEAPVKTAELTGNTSRTYKFIKRAFDIVASAVGLILCIPVFVVAGIAIKLEDPKGPVFYHQPRIGMNGKEFTFYKLRSMYTNADAIKASLMDRNEMDGPVFKMKNDPRVTKVGHFLRRTSIDELPQLWNVLRGEMSLVGPRPLPTKEELACSTYQRQRELVKPGLTCYWQVSGRNDVTFHDWVELDLRYIREQSLGTDLNILAKTVAAVVHGGGSILSGSVLLTETKCASFRLPWVLKAALCFPLLQAVPTAGTSESAGTRAETELQKAEPSIGYRFIKRMFDIAVSVIALIVLSPLLLVVFILIFLDDPKGSPIFVQTRVGKDGKEFRFYKFRSMVVNAEAQLDSLMDQNEMDGPVFKIKNDPRITRMGKFIRKTSIDELPQLWNVLRGDMSIVGPRPPVPREVVQYSDYQRQRLSVTPGLTCYWQVRKDRNMCSFDEWVEMDLQYIQDRSIKTDIKIILKTFGAVLGMNGE